MASFISHANQLLLSTNSKDIKLLNYHDIHFITTNTNLIYCFILFYFIANLC